MYTAQTETTHEIVFERDPQAGTPAAPPCGLRSASGRRETSQSCARCRHLFAQTKNKLVLKLGMTQAVRSLDNPAPHPIMDPPYEQGDHPATR